MTTPDHCSPAIHLPWDDLAPASYRLVCNPSGNVIYICKECVGWWLMNDLLSGNSPISVELIDEGGR